MHFLHSLPALPWFAEEEWCTYVCTYAYVGAGSMHGKVEACTPTCMCTRGCAQPYVCKTFPASPRHTLGLPPPAQLSDSLISRSTSSRGAATSLAQ